MTNPFVVPAGEYQGRSFIDMETINYDWLEYHVKKAFTFNHETPPAFHDVFYHNLRRTYQNPFTYVHKRRPHRSNALVRHMNSIHPITAILK